LIVLEIQHVEVDHCTTCGGVWLDGGELEVLLENASNRDALMATLVKSAGGKEKEIECPICDRKLERVLYGTGDKILLDMCKQDHGIWFDKGELLAVIEMGEFAAHARVYEVIADIFGSTRS